MFEVTMGRKSSGSTEYNQIWSLIIIGAGILLRLVYVLKSTIYDRQYDIGMIDLDLPERVTGGHLGYIQHLYQHMSLPDVDPSTVYQFHHPPFHHFVSVMFMKFVSLFTTNNDIIEESMQCVPLICSLITLWAASEIIKRFKIEGREYNFAMAILCFHPSLIMLSGSVNNDCMALMFSVLAIFSTMQWIENKSYWNITKIALCLGLGISTKQNVAEVSFAVGAVFLIVLFKELATKKNHAELILQYVLAGAISLPLGMWFYVRNLIKYNMSLLWVYELPVDSWQYTGNVPVINRFLWPMPAEMIDNIKNFKIGCGYNVWMQIMRTSVLGEWDMASVGKGTKLIAVMLMLVGATIALVAFLCFTKTFVFNIGGGKQSPVKSLYRVLFVVGYFGVMASYLMFAYKYPHQCSMHFRYIEITLLFPMVAMAMCYGKLKSRRIRNVWDFAVTIFAVLSVLMCAVWCFA